MSRFKAGVGVLVLSAICVCAIGVGSASALTAHECLAAVGTSTEYTSGSCTTAGAGGFHTVPLSAGKHKIKVTRAGTGVSTLAVTVSEVKFKISCTGESGSGEIENTGTGTGSQIIGSGIVVSYEGCTVVEPAGKGCAVPSTITTNSMNAETPKETMKTVYSPTTGETFFTIVVSGCTAEALNGSKPVTGTEASIVETATPKVQEFTASSGSALKIGGSAATLISSNGTDTTDGTAIAAETP
jgi:hypothetical protein